MGVDHGGLKAGMAQQGLNHADVIACLQEVGGEGMPESMCRDLFGDFGSADCIVECFLQFGLVQVIAPQFPGFHHGRQRLLWKEEW